MWDRSYVLFIQHLLMLWSQCMYTLWLYGTRDCIIYLYSISHQRRRCLSIWSDAQTTINTSLPYKPARIDSLVPWHSYWIRPPLQQCQANIADVTSPIIKQEECNLTCTKTNTGGWNEISLSWTNSHTQNFAILGCKDWRYRYCLLYTSDAADE